MRLSNKTTNKNKTTNTTTTKSNNSTNSTLSTTTTMSNIDTLDKTPIEIALQIDDNGMTTASNLYTFLKLHPAHFFTLV